MLFSSLVDGFSGLAISCSRSENLAVRSCSGVDCVRITATQRRNGARRPRHPRAAAGDRTASGMTAPNRLGTM